MNLIIRSTKTVKFHTNLSEVLKPVWDDLKDYEWVLTDLDFISDDNIPVNFDKDFFVLNHKEFEVVYNSRTQIIWGIISAIPKNTTLNPETISKLSAEDPGVWESNEFLIPESYLEIVAFDSSYTIVKFRDENLSRKFKDHFGDQVTDLQKFKEK